MEIIIIIAGFAIVIGYLIHITKKLKKIMNQNDQLSAIATENAATLAELSAGQTTLIADVQAATNANKPVPQYTIDALQASADGMKTIADQLNAALNPVAPVVDVPTSPGPDVAPEVTAE